MHTQTKSAGVTFTVHDVEPVRTKLPTRKTRDLLGRLLKDFDQRDQKAPLYISGYNSDCLEETASYHTLFSTIHLAFAEHRPLVLSPDMIWLTILQGFAQHVRNNSETLRYLLVAHKGKAELAISRIDDFIESPEYDWESVIHDFAGLLGSKLGDKYTQLVSNFSTTGALERLVCEVTLMDVFESYFEYVMYAGCGIPSITLEGLPADWKHLREKVEFLQPYQLDWWLADLRQITEQFYRASIGDVDKDFWLDMYKQRNAYGYTRINGWIARLIPYVRNSQSGECIYRNPVFSEDASLWDDESNRSGLRSDELPSGLAKVPFKVLVGKMQEEREMQFLAGFVGAEQDESTGALRPMLGWAVRQAPDSSTYMNNVPKNVVKAPPPPSETLTKFMEELIGTDWRPPVEIPGSFFTFYKNCDGMHLELDGEIVWRIRPIAELEKFASMKSTADPLVYAARAAFEQWTPEEHKADTDLSKKEDQYDSPLDFEVNPSPNKWLRFLDENNGSYLCLELGQDFRIFRVEASGKARLLSETFEGCIRGHLDSARSIQHETADG